MDFLEVIHFIQTARMAVDASPSRRNALCVTAPDGLLGVDLKWDGSAGHAKVQATTLQMRDPANNRNLRSCDAYAAKYGDRPHSLQPLDAARYSHAMPVSSKLGGFRPTGHAWLRLLQP